MQIEAGKGSPELTTTTDPSIRLKVPAQLSDEQFVQFLEALSNEQNITLNLHEIIELEKVRKGQRGLHPDFKERFLSLGIVERVGSGRGVHYILSRRYYQYTNSMGQHTRLSGLNSAVKKNIIIEHLRRNGHVTNAELQVAMPEMEMKAISNLLSRMSKENVIQHVGTMRSGHWELITPPGNDQSRTN